MIRSKTATSVAHNRRSRDEKRQRKIGAINPMNLICFQYKRDNINLHVILLQLKHRRVLIGSLWCQIS